MDLVHVEVAETVEQAQPVLETVKDYAVIRIGEYIGRGGFNTTAF